MPGSTFEKHWLTGIGPTANWTLYDTAGGRLLPGEDVRHYLHNSYQWVWLRYSPIGLVVFVAFLAITAATLMRSWAPPSRSSSAARSSVSRQGS